MLILTYISFDSYLLSRSFDHICMEKARYKFLIIIFILLLLLVLDKNRRCDNLIHLWNGILFFFKGP